MFLNFPDEKEINQEHVRSQMNFFNLFGFLEPPGDPFDKGDIDLPSSLFQGEKLIPLYSCFIDRDFETGDAHYHSSPVAFSTEFRAARGKSDKDLQISEIANLQNELHRRVKGKFSLETLNVPSVNDHPASVKDEDPCEQLLSDVPHSALKGLGLLDSPVLQSLNLENLAPTTQRLIKKRLLHFEPIKRYAVVEDTSQQLPKFLTLIKDPAYTWPFEPDTFQKQAILCLERNQSVFVAAHTSAGKTVIAEYASAMCRRRGSRVIYTSPIKALSNQKFHDFRRTFGEDVGLLTGDIKVATDSSLLVMTTEILHNMLCNAADAIRDLEIVIMDEVHYLNDAERGHVWEQIMIMLPKHVLLVMLSATVPNTVDFADWLGRIRDSEIHVVATDRRPVPLEHFLFTGLDGQATDKQLHLIVDQNSCFNLPGYKQAVIAFNSPKTKKTVDKDPGTNTRADELKAMGRGGESKPRAQYTGGKRNTPGRWSHLGSGVGARSVHEKRTKNLWLGVVRLLQQRELMPAIAFGFSRNSLEVLAEHLSSVDLLNQSEKNEVKHFLRYSIENHLKGPDAKLPSVLCLRDLVLRGLAVHHAGMLPLLKETVEMLFQRGLIRLLFATETFAMGVNMPARCVLFSTLEKFDGRGRRPLNPGEYTQMAGRAGRRGLDASGAVIIIVEGIGQSVASVKSGVPSQETLTRMILGTPAQLVSQFKITYSMILHLHRTNWLSPRDIMRRSFMEANALRRETERRRWLTCLRNRLSSTTTVIPSAGASASTSFGPWSSKTAPVAASNAVPMGEPVLQVKCPSGQVECADTMATYYQACCKFRQLSASVSSVIANQPLSDLQRLFCPGRLVFIRLPAVSQRSGVHIGGSIPDWLVPAMIVDVTKSSVQGVTQAQWSLITWQTPERPTHCAPPRASSATDALSTTTTTPKCSTVEEVVMDEDEEEEILLEGEDSWMSQTPFPPQLMPIFVPSSFEDAMSRLTLLSDQDSHSLVRVCDCVVEFRANRTVTAKSPALLVEHLTRAARRHRQEMVAAEAGLRLMVGTNTSDADIEWTQLMVETNTGLLDLLKPLIPPDRSAADRPSLFTYGLLPDYPPPRHLGRSIRSKTNTDDSCSLLDELWLLSEELTSPLIGQTVTQRLAPVTCPDLVAHFALFHRTCRRRWAVKRLEASLSVDTLRLSTEYTGRLRVLEELGFIDSATERGCLSLKGLVACELQQMEVLITQLLLDGSFTQLPAADIAALLSCFVFEVRPSGASARDESTAPRTAPPTQQLVSQLVLSESAGDSTHPQAPPLTSLNVKTDVDSPKCTTVPEHLRAQVVKMFEFAAQLEQLQSKHGLMDPTMDTRLNCSLVRVTHAWATGHPFSTLVHLTDMSEGNLVRGLLRLDELLRHICNACHRLGDAALGLRMNEARMAVHRDLVCAPSLYISDEFVREMDVPST